MIFCLHALTPLSALQAGSIVKACSLLRHYSFYTSLYYFDIKVYTVNLFRLIKNRFQDYRFQKNL